MKLLYIWIEEFRNIINQGFVVDDEFNIIISNPEKSVPNYYTNDGYKFFSNERKPVISRKIYDREITVSKNNHYSSKSSDSAIRSVSALVGKNASGKTSILECICAEGHDFGATQERYFFLVFWDEKNNCIEIRSKGIHLSAQNIKCHISREHDDYIRYIISLSNSASFQTSPTSGNTHFFFLTRHKEASTYIGYNILDLPTTIGDLDAFNRTNSHEGVFNFLCSFPHLGGAENRLVVYLKEKNLGQVDYFLDSKYSPKEIKELFIYKLSRILFSNLRKYLYHQKPEIMADGSLLRFPNEDQLRHEDEQCAKLLAFTNIDYPNFDSYSLISTKINGIPEKEISCALEFFASSTFTGIGKSGYDEYVSAIRALFNAIIKLDDNLFTALYKIEIPFEHKYTQLVSAMQKCFNLDSMQGNWLSGIYMDFEWFSAGEYHLAMLFSAIYQRMTEDRTLLSGTDIVWFIDEPEMHMHPEITRSFMSTLNTSTQKFYDQKLIGQCQFVFATHSPFIIQSLNEYNSSLTLISKKSNRIYIQPFNELTSLKLPDRNEFSFNLIMYKVFDIPTIELHNELYGELQIIADYSGKKSIEKWFCQKGLSQNMNWIRETKEGSRKSEPVTLQTYIRNSIHHPENRSNTYKFTENDLRTSIDTMINLLEL